MTDVAPEKEKLVFGQPLPKKGKKRGPSIEEKKGDGMSEARKKVERTPCRICGWTTDAGATCGYCLEIARQKKAQDERLARAKAMAPSERLEAPDQLAEWASTKKDRYRVFRCEKCLLDVAEMLFPVEKKNESGQTEVLLMVYGEKRSPASYATNLCEHCNCLRELLLQFSQRKALIERRKAQLAISDEGEAF